MDAVFATVFGSDYGRQEVHAFPLLERLSLGDCVFRGIPQGHQLAGMDGQDGVRAPILSGKLHLEHRAILGHDDGTDLPAAQQ